MKDKSDDNDCDELAGVNRGGTEGE